MTLSEFGLRLGIAFALGAAIGLERQWRQRSAGLRTNTLVCIGSAGFILLSEILTANTFGDPSRVAGQIVTGIGFLGAGVIMKDGVNVQGLNTAATIWCSASVGAIVGAGYFTEGSILTLVIVATHFFFRPLGLLMNQLPFQKEESTFSFYSVKIRCKEQVENHLRVLMLSELQKNEKLQLRSLKSSDNGDPTYAYVEADVLSVGRNDAFIEKLAGKLTIEYGVTEVSWEVNGHSNDD